MKDDIISYLKSYKRATITLGELESLVPGNMKYDEFAGCIMELVEDNVLVEKKPEINNGKDIPLPYKFGINKYELKKDYIDFLQNYSLSISSEIDLQKYFAGSFEELKRDKPYIDKINEYICKNGLPKEYATSQERSFYLVGDEKWIDEKSGRKLIDKIGLWNKLKMRMEVLKEMEKKLNEIAGNLDKKADRVKVQKENFVDFCQNDILDVKLKEMSVTGIEYNRNFEAILEWQNKMSERIMHIVKITEDDMRNHDREIQQFINQLHSYLKTISDELRRLPKSTRIKIDGKWKEVFLFTIPEWNEKEGRERLAEYIDWMLNQLQGDQFKDENGKEDVEKVRKSIEKWLQSKQLLQYVMKQNTIKVKCRKVTNDGKMSSLPFSWETSNQWSGGEKWSKNMTLFLGILNYLAEKRIRMASDCKRHRAVIMDNPFGKASSEHVLDPVFFIAEQLGFQIIALTAHSEGKFIRTYFPIVYSCKLREASDGINQIMTKELEMKKAFFRDNDPQSLTRLT